MTGDADARDAQSEVRAGARAGWIITLVVIIVLLVGSTSRRRPWPRG